MQIKQTEGIRPGTWEVHLSPAVKAYLLSTPRKDVDIPGVTRRTIDNLRKKVGASKTTSKNHWYNNPVAQLILTEYTAKQAADILDKTIDSIDWAKRQKAESSMLQMAWIEDEHNKIVMENNELTDASNIINKSRITIAMNKYRLGIKDVDDFFDTKTIGIIKNNSMKDTAVLMGVAESTVERYRRMLGISTYSPTLTYKWYESETAAHIIKKYPTAVVAQLLNIPLRAVIYARHRLRVITKRDWAKEMKSPETRQIIQNNLANIAAEKLGTTPAMINNLRSKYNIKYAGKHDWRRSPPKS